MKSKNKVEQATLKDTVEQMTSDDYKERLRAEYEQLKYRYERLRRIILKYDFGKLDFTPTTPMGTLRRQCDVMKNYIDVLEERMVIEGIVF